MERFLEAEHKNATLHKAYDDLEDRMDRVDSVLKKCIFVHSFRCERYKEALENKGKELVELEKKLQYETSRRKDTQRYYENLFIAKTGYEKLARQEHQSKQDKKINELQAELNLFQAQNKCKEGEIRSLKNQAARGRTYSLLGFQIILICLSKVLSLARKANSLCLQIAAAITTKIHILNCNSVF